MLTIMSAAFGGFSLYVGLLLWKHSNREEIITKLRLEIDQLTMYLADAKNEARGFKEAADEVERLKFELHGTTEFLAQPVAAKLEDFPRPGDGET